MTQTMPVEMAKALKAYNSAGPDGKALLIDLLGEEIFNQKITDRVKSFEDACQVLGLNPSSYYFLNDTPDEIAFKKLKIIIKALNEGWIADWNNASQRKWYPWFYMNAPGFRFDASGYVIVFSYSYVGSRLCVHSEELSNYLAKQFLPLYNDLLN